MIKLVILADLLISKYNNDRMRQWVNNESLI